MTDLDHLQYVFLEARNWVATVEREVQEAREASLRAGGRQVFAGRGNTEASSLRVEMAMRTLDAALSQQERAFADYQSALKRSARSLMATS